MKVKGRRKRPAFALRAETLSSVCSGSSFADCQSLEPHAPTRAALTSDLPHVAVAACLLALKWNTCRPGAACSYLPGGTRLLTLELLRFRELGETSRSER